MVKYLLPLIFLFSVWQLQAQSLPDFYSQQNVPCAVDSNTTVLGYPNWEVYQTLDDTWNGPRDTASCVNFVPSTLGYIATIRFSEIDPAKTVFVRALFSPILLQEDALYQFNGNFFASANAIAIADTCAEGLCSGLSVRVTIPDSAGTGQNYRWYSSSTSGGFCLPTEYFVDNNYLTEIIYRFKYVGTLANDSVRLYSPSLSYNYSTNKVYGPLVATPHTGGHYQYRFDERPDYYYWGTNYLFMYDTANGYPAHSNLYYMDVVPDPNPATIDTIDVVMGENGYDLVSYVFQPHTRLQGANPDGDSVNRHVLNIINEGANLCLDQSAEKMFEKSAQYRHHAGEIHFNDRNSCMLFGQGGKLVVADGASFVYGNNGQGMMALKSGGTIEIGKGAELLVGGHITMFEYEWENQSTQIYMELNEGSKLIFLPGSKLTNMHSRFGQVKLNIYMNGGLLDDSGLSPEDKRHINLIYPTLKRYLADNLQIMPNPAEGHLRLQYNTKTDAEVLLSVCDLSGKIVYTISAQAYEGMNFIETETLPLPGGTYLLKAQVGDQVAVKRFVLL